MITIGQYLFYFLIPILFIALFYFLTWLIDLIILKIEKGNKMSHQCNYEKFYNKPCPKCDPNFIKSGKDQGLIEKYYVRKYSKPEKKMDCIVLEFDDPIARKAIMRWAVEMERAGYQACAADVYAKLRVYD